MGDKLNIMKVPTTKDKMIILIRNFDQSTLFCQFQTEVHDVCHCLRTSYDKLSQVLLVRTIQLPNSLMAVSSSDIATEAGLSPSSTGQLQKGPSMSFYPNFIVILS